MNKLETAQILIAASILAAFFVVPSMADDYAQPQPMPSREPVYVWQGNRIDNPAAAPATAPTLASIPVPGSSAMPQPMQAGPVRYITGGIGDEERAALESVKNDYNLRITSTDNSGEFKGDTQISIFDPRGQTLLTIDAGPMLYADLPAGTYKVQAMSDGRSEERKVTVGEKNPSSLYFRW